MQLLSCQQCDKKYTGVRDARVSVDPGYKRDTSWPYYGWIILEHAYCQQCKDDIFLRRIELPETRFVEPLAVFLAVPDSDAPVQEDLWVRAQRLDMPYPIV
ncbi:hypothetical protein LCGC14_2543440, partial [marine sediment metagenome]